MGASYSHSTDPPPLFPIPTHNGETVLVPPNTLFSLPGQQQQQQFRNPCPFNSACPQRQRPIPIRVRSRSRSLGRNRRYNNNHHHHRYHPRSPTRRHPRRDFSPPSGTAYSDYTEEQLRQFFRHRDRDRGRPRDRRDRRDHFAPESTESQASNTGSTGGGGGPWPFQNSSPPGRRRMHRDGRYGGGYGGGGRYGGHGYRPMPRSLSRGRMQPPYAYPFGEERPHSAPDLSGGFRGGGPPPPMGGMGGMGGMGPEDYPGGSPGPRLRRPMMGSPGNPYAGYPGPAGAVGTPQMHPMAMAPPPHQQAVQPQQPRRPPMRPPGLNEIPMAAYTAAPARANTEPPPTSKRLNRTQHQKNNNNKKGVVGPSGQEWLQGDPFLDACTCTTNCTCRKGHRVLYRSQAQDGDGNNGFGEIRYVLKDDLGRDCGDHSGCRGNDEEGEDKKKGRKGGKKGKKDRDEDGEDGAVSRKDLRDLLKTVTETVINSRAEGLGGGPGAGQMRAGGMRASPFGGGGGGGGAGDAMSSTMQDDNMDPRIARMMMGGGGGSGGPRMIQHPGMMGPMGGRPIRPSRMQPPTQMGPMGFDDEMSMEDNWGMDMDPMDMSGRGGGGRQMFGRGPIPPNFNGPQRPPRGRGGRPPRPHPGMDMDMSMGMGMGPYGPGPPRGGGRGRPYMGPRGGGGRGGPGRRAQLDYGDDDMGFQGGDMDDGAEWEEMGGGFGGEEDEDDDGLPIRPRGNPPRGRGGGSVGRPDIRRHMDSRGPMGGQQARVEDDDEDI